MEADINRNESLTGAPAESLQLSAPDGAIPPQEPQLTPEQRKTLAIIIILAIVIVLLIAGSIVFLLNQPARAVAQIRDVFIIFMAIGSIFTGLALVVLLVQLARLINLLQNEVKPILDLTNETVSNLRGTTIFLSDNLVGPVIKMNEHLAGLTQLLQIVGLMKRTSKTRTPKGE